MKRFVSLISLTGILLSLLGVHPAELRAAENISITELLPSPTTSQVEYVEFYNAGTTSFALKDFQLQTGIAVTHTYKFGSQTLSPQSYTVFTSNTITLTLLNTSGVAKLLDSSGNAVTQTDPYGNAPSGQAWALIDGIWRWTSTPTLGAANVATAAPTPPASPSPSTPNPSPSSSPSPVTTSGLTPPTITELLPNPAAPQSDDKDEFIELYNPNSITFPLKGYKLQTGAKYSYSQTLTDQVLPPNSYMVFTSGTTSLTLSNTSGGAQLLDPSGAVVDQADNYGAAGEGVSWARVNGSWQWTTTPTPNAANILTGAGGTVSPPTATTKMPVSAKPKTTAVKAAKTTKASKAKTGAVAAKTTAVSDSEQKAPSPLHPLILAGVGTLAVVYGVYEYRHDLANLVYKFKRYRATRRATGKSS